MANSAPNTMTPDPATTDAIELKRGKSGQMYWNAVPSAWAM